MRKLLLIVFALGLSAAPAFADAIDGHWCSPDGRHLLIKGRAITTPSGAHLEGDYTRHSFSYVAPAGEPDAGVKILMRLAGETRVYVSAEGTGGDPQLWQRCEEISRLLHGFALASGG